MPSLMWLLNTVNRCASLYHGDRLSDTDLKPPHARCIVAVCRHPGFSQDQLAKHLCQDKSQIARYLAYLEEKGYVTRSPGVDKRVLLVYPTPKAEAIVPTIREIYRDWNEWLIAEFSPEEQALFSSLMARAKDRAVAYVQGGEDLPPHGTQREE
ncbi:MAG: MarR family transcriptional regulator [Clostridia bacterium]|nr:MarR family transcriptional regulator [Clostridia bacterium]